MEVVWFSRLAPYLPVEIPEPIAIGEPVLDYPFRWALHRWIPGEGASLDRVGDPVAFAHDLAVVVRSLQSVPTAGARAARNRACPLRDYDGATRSAITHARDLIDVNVATRVWEEALTAEPHRGPSV